VIRAKPPIWFFLLSLLLIGSTATSAYLRLTNLEESNVLFRSLDVFSAIGIVLFGFSGCVVGSGLRAHPKYTVIFSIGIMFGIIVTLTIEQQVLLWGTLLIIVIIDGAVFSTVITDIQFRNMPLESENIKPLIQLMFFMIFLVAFIPTLIPVETISEGLLRTADEALKWTNSATGEQLPPGPSYIELINNVGMDRWFFPAGLLIRFISRFPERMK
jgi:hypothetical protein